MNEIFDQVAAYSVWFFPVFIPLLCYLVYSGWEAHSRKMSNRELKILNELRREGAITQEEFDEKKEALLAE